MRKLFWVMLTYQLFGYYLGNVQLKSIIIFDHEACPRRSLEWQFKNYFSSFYSYSSFFTYWQWGNPKRSGSIFENVKKLRLQSFQFHPLMTLLTRTCNSSYLRTLCLNFPTLFFCSNSVQKSASSAWLCWY